jgi:hypothetical protein
MSNPTETDIRDYGLGNPDKVGVPSVQRLTAVGELDDCPNCGCRQLAVIEIMVEHQLLRTGHGLGTYLSCPACPYASPMVCQPVESPKAKA